ncbi:hypothetical protein M3Y97_00550700 [Aphelenchoides bicaudatus]|nr:hypothetical protein M3Y97_00550700 [Aphelenchoides bicaudatus]
MLTRIFKRENFLQKVTGSLAPNHKLKQVKFFGGLLSISESPAELTAHLCIYGVMGKIIPVWIEIWLIASTVICTLDVTYTMLRPHTLRNIYSDVDIRYGTTSDLTSMATGRLMIIELVMNILAIFMDRARSRHTLLTVFSTTLMVFWKTAVYLCLYVFPAEGNPDYIAPGASCLKVFLIFWVPNLFWMFVPFTVLVSLWNRLALPESDRHSSQNTLIAGDEITEKSNLYSKPEQRSENCIPTV